MTNINGQFARGCRLFKEGRPEQAIAIFDEIAKLQSPWWLRMHRAIALAELGRFDEARSEIAGCAAEKPDSAPVQIFKARIEWDAGAADRALDAASLAQKLDPENRLARAYAGLANLALGNVSEGYEMLHGIAYIMNTAFQARLLFFIETRLKECPNAKELEDAIAETLRPARQENPAREPNALSVMMLKARSKLRHPFKPIWAKAEKCESLAWWHLTKGNFRSAAECYEIAASLRPDNAAVKERLADIYYELKEYEKTAAIVKEAGDPSEWAADPEILNLKTGAALYKLNRFEEALEYLLRAQSGVVEFWPQYYAGLCELRLGRESKARNYFAKGLSQLNPKVVETRLDELKHLHDKGKLL